MLMACIGAPFILLGVGLGGFLALSGDIGTAAYALAPFFIGLWCLLEISTVRLNLSGDRLWLSRWWHTRWSISRDQAELREACVGDLPVLPGLHVIDRSSGTKVGEITSGQFRPTDLSKLAILLATHTD